jgi:hypothetical protein
MILRFYIKDDVSKHINFSDGLVVWFYQISYFGTSSLFLKLSVSCI